MTQQERWTKAIEKLDEAACAVRELGEEWERWRDSIPENLDDSPIAEKLDEMLDIVTEIDDIGTSTAEWSEMELPRVGRGTR